MYLIGATGLNEGLISITSTNPVYTGSGRAFSGFGIWPKCSAGIRKTINKLMGSRIWLLPRKWDLPNLGTACRIDPTYILHLLASVEIRLFNLFFWEKKKQDLGYWWKMSRIWNSCEERIQNGGPFQTLFTIFSWTEQLVIKPKLNALFKIKIKNIGLHI